MCGYGRAGLVCLCAAWVLCGCGAGAGAGGEAGLGVLVRAENLTVTPSTGPVTHVAVCNVGARAFRGTVSVTFPAGWKLNTTRQRLAIEPGKTVRVPFAIERGVDLPANRYPVEIAVEAGSRREVRRQEIVCASAPYSRPTIDGKLDDWKDAIPATFATAGRQTTVSTYWSRRRFSVLVAVTEDALKRMGARWDGAAIDAVQFAVSPRGAATPRGWLVKVRRYEFLLAAGEGGARCLALVRPGDNVASLTPASLRARGVEGAEVVVVRREGVTYYECSIPFAAMPQIRPEPGREFCFSLLVHDPDGTGLRDWGEAAGLWPGQRTPWAWCSWPGAIRPEKAAFDNKIEWGFCSSKH